MKDDSIRVPDLPILVDWSQMENMQQVEKTNTILRILYHGFKDHTFQRQLTEPPITNLVQTSSERCVKMRDYCYQGFVIISFDFSSYGMQKGTVYPILKIKKGKILSPNIAFTGVNSKYSPTSILNQYGYFLYTYNKASQEQQISFKTFDDVTPSSTIWGVTLWCRYQPNETMER